MDVCAPQDFSQLCKKKSKVNIFCILDKPIFIVVYLGYFIVTNTVLRFDQHLHMFLEL
jgi:hypothetical protein